MESAYERTELLLGEDAVKKLKDSKVIIAGIGGVGSYAAEALARCFIGRLNLIDFDTIAISNINRQIHANIHTIGKSKADEMKKRIIDINPYAEVEVFSEFVNGENVCRLVQEDVDYIIDAIDTVSSKIELILCAKRLNIPIISSMGAGNKLHPEMLTLGDIYETSVCPLARVMRRELKKRGVHSLKVCYSKEQPVKLSSAENERPVPGSISFVPSAAGLIIAGQVVRDIMKGDD